MGEQPEGKSEIRSIGTVGGGDGLRSIHCFPTTSKFDERWNNIAKVVALEHILVQP